MTSSTPRAEVVLIGQVMVGVGAGGVRRAEALGVADGRIVAVGSRQDVERNAAPRPRICDFGPAAIVPGIHDFHLHLVGMARARREVSLDDCADADALIGRLAAAAARLPHEAWLNGRGWQDRVLLAADPQRLSEAVAGRAAVLYSHDSHSAWASPRALAAAGLRDDSPDPPGGRIERDATGRLTGVLRETAADLLDRVVGVLSGPPLGEALDEAMAELAALGVTGATDAGDTTAANGIGEAAALGDRPSQLIAHRERIDGRLRLTINVPVEAIEALAAMGLRTGAPWPGTRTLRAGWAKGYVDGTLGSRTAACEERFTCDPGGHGLLRLGYGELVEIARRARAARIGLALHAIGDRAVETSLRALRDGPPAGDGAPPDRLEHLQLLGGDHAARIAAARLTASLQPIHVAADRALAEACWADRLPRTYATQALHAAGARLAFGSDAPTEAVNPWLGVFAAAHRRQPRDGTPDWQPQQAIGAAIALAAYTHGPAEAIGAAEEGRLEVGAHADLAVLNIDLDGLLAADERLADVGSVLTMVAGSEVHRA